MTDVALDVRITSHMSDGMRAYTDALRARLPRVASDLRIAPFGDGDNFDAAEQLRMPLWIAQRQPRLVHYTTPFVPLVNPRPYVVTVHDLIELRFPEFGKKKVRPYFRFVVAPVVRRARAAICDDARMIAELERFLGVRPERVRVVPLGVDERFFAAPAESASVASGTRPYVLYVGNRRAHKDLETLYGAWSQLPADCALDLKLTGFDDPAIAEQFRRENGAVVALGFLEADDLRAAYAGALAYVQTSLFEGFGLPMAEAAACGVPVVATTTSVPAPLEAGALTFSPGDAGALAAHIARLARDPLQARAIGARLQAAARDLTWDRCAEATAAVYREFLE